MAVAEAHALGIVHRDLKPSNLFCVRRADGQFIVKVLDFGISKITDVREQAFSATATTAIMGSPLYMSPEQMASSKNVTPQSDIWALGVILFELVAGAVPFNGDTLPEICIKIATTPPLSLRRVRPDVPPAFEAIVAKCLEKDLRLRYGDVAELAQSLRMFAPERAWPLVDRIAGILHADVRPRSGTVTNQSMATSASDLVIPGKVTHRQRTGIAIAAVAAVVAASVGVFAARSQHPSATAAPAASSTDSVKTVSLPPPASASEPEAGPAVEGSPAASLPVRTPVPLPSVAPPAAAGPVPHAAAAGPRRPVPTKDLPKPPPSSSPQTPPVKSYDYDHL